MKKITLFFTAVYIVISTVSPVFSQIDEGYYNGINYIDKDDIEKTITYLASDDMKGRAAGTAENLKAARFIAERFCDFGLTPYADLLDARRAADRKKKRETRKKSGDNLSPGFYDDYFQRFNLVETSINQTESKLKFIKGNENGSKTYCYNFGSDFIVDFSSHKNITINAPLVFLGYGIGKDDNEYNDFLLKEGKEIDVKNKIVLIVDGYPRQADTTSYFSNSKNTEIKSIKKKSANLYEKGALAVLVVQSPIQSQPHFAIKMERMDNAFSKSDFDLPESKPGESVPIVYVSRDVLNDIFENSGKDCAGILNSIEKNLKPVPFQFQDITVNMSFSYDKKVMETQNVIGFLEGSDPVLKDEYVVVGAHYDHVGLGYYGAMDKTNIGQIHNGADDNASGTSGLIEVAEAFSKVKPKRSIIFIGFSAEENGIHGSRYYVYQNPVKPLDKTVGMVNLDMIGRNDSNLVWVGGIFYSGDLKNLVEDANTIIGFELLYNVGLLTFGSDQAPFIRKEIPSLFFFAGLHDDYHTPSDDADKIDFVKTERVSKLAYISAWLLANRQNMPEYKNLGMEEKTALVKDSLAKQKKYRTGNTNTDTEDEL